ncbi:hypothetical protein L7F22_016822 [Adiantum nelumboides]|nr:hypothetical protein [Adiantum nelumboides]
MFQSLETQLNLNTAYHPETDGQTERVNKVIEDMLRAYCNQQPQKWIKFLHLVKFAYNSSHHRSLGMSPFKALHGEECLVPLQLTDPTLHVPTAKSTLEAMDRGKIDEYFAPNLEPVWTPKSYPLLLPSSSKSGSDIASSSSAHSSIIIRDSP